MFLKNLTVFDAKLTEDNENVKVKEGYNTVNLEQAFKVAANLPEGARLDGDQYVEVTDNGDGTFTLILKSANGGINVRAILKPVEDKTSSETQYEVVAVSESSEPTTTTPSAPPAGAIVVATVAAPAPNATPSPISGTKAAVIENVASVPAGYDVSKLLDSYGYCGFLRLLDILGGTEIK